MKHAFRVLAFVFVICRAQHALAVDCATWNPEDKGPSVTLSGNNLTATGASWNGARATISNTTGKWYFEIAFVSGTYVGCGVASAAASLTSEFSNNAQGWGYYSHGWIANNGSASATSGYGAGTVCRVALDLGAGKLWLGAGSSWVGGGNPAAGTSPTYTSVSGTLFPIVTVYGGASVTANFGQSAFAYSVPEGFNAGWYCDDCEAEPEEPKDLSLLPAFMMFGVSTYVAVGAAMALCFIQGFLLFRGRAS
jgi:hypothetical protein